MATDHEPIEAAFPSVIEAFSKCGVFVELKFDHLFEPESSPGYMPIVGLAIVAAKAKYTEIEVEFDAYTPIPVPSHQDAKSWAYLLAYNIRGHMFNELHNRIGRDAAIEFYKRTEDAVHELTAAAN